MNLYKLLIVTILVTMISGCYPSAPSGKTQLVLQGRTMGTTYNITIVADTNGFDKLSLQKKIDQKLVDINQAMSTYIPDSELSLFNQHKSLDSVEISSELAVVMEEAIRIGSITDGKLDVTAGKIINLWGFGPDKKPNVTPSEQEIELAKSQSGITNLVLDGNSLSKKVPELYVDLSTIAKGYGVDVVAALLEENGINDYIVEVGGEMRLKGFKHTGELWHVAIEKPVTNERSVHQIIVPQDNALATSGDYRNYFEVDGQRYSHIIDPATAKPINHRLVSVTVIHPSSMTADALSTAMMVMGEKRALAFAKENDLAAYIIAKTDNGFVEESTVKFMKYMK